MKRVLLPILLVAVLAFLGAVVAVNPGAASLQWLGWRIDTTASLVTVLGVLASLLLAALWVFLAWLVRTPRRMRRARAEARLRQARAILDQGRLALAAGDAASALHLAQAAAALDDGPASHLLAADAALALGDDAAAQGAYAHLLAIPEAQAVARRGLDRLALKRGEIVPETPPPPPSADDPLKLDR